MIVSVGSALAHEGPDGWQAKAVDVETSYSLQRLALSVYCKRRGFGTACRGLRIRRGVVGRAGAERKILPGPAVRGKNTGGGFQLVAAPERRCNCETTMPSLGAKCT